MTEETQTTEQTEVQTTEEKPTERTFTQAEIDEIIQKRVGQANRVARRELEEKLGASVDDVAKILTERKAAEEAEKSELQKAQEAIETMKREAEAEKATLLAQVHQRDVKDALRDAGVRDGLDEVAKMVDAPIGANADELKTAVESLKAKLPALFASPPPPNSQPSGTPQTQGSGQSLDERMKDAAKQFSGL